jgi:hypothetical protein
MSIFQKNSENIFLKLCTQFVQIYFVSIYGYKINRVFIYFKTKEKN